MIALVALQLGAVTTIILSSYFTSERVLLGHARDLMMEVSNQTIEHSINFLEPAQDAADLSQRLAQQQVVNSENPDSLEKYFFEQLQSSAQFAGIFYGSATGAFVYVKRDSSVEGAAYRTKIISFREDPQGGERQRVVDLIWRDNAFALVTQKRDDADSYDPRARPWYEKASQRRSPAWTDPYIFYTSKNPGITVAAPVLAGAQGIKGVVAVDIEILEISEFLADLVIGKSGGAFIMNRAGDVIAHPDPAKIKSQLSDGSDGLRFTRIDEISDPMARSAFAALGTSAHAIGVNRPVFTSFELEGERHHAVFTPLPQGQWPWIVGIYVPENDFLGTIKENRQNNIIIALVIAAVSALIGLMIARSITRPIAALYAQANKIARGKWPRIDHISTRFEELGRAGTAFNRMALWLDSYKEDNEKLTADLRAATRELEVRVEERTATLVLVNDQLRTEIADRKVAEVQLAQEALQHKATAEALRDARDRANAANRAKSRFLSNMSHELRTPMNVVLGFAQMLEYPIFRDQPERVEAYVKNILESGGQLLELIDQVLDLAKIEAGKMLLAIQPVASDKIVALAVDQTRVLAEPGKIELIDETDPAMLRTVLADEGRLRQALMNLLSNAVKYNRPGGTVILRSSIRGAYLRITVEDSGRGIPAEMQDQLFEPFNRLGAENSAIQGTGVGLALSKEVLERMGGRIGCKSEAGVGSSFWLDLPLAQPGSIIAAYDNHPARNLARTVFEGEMRILYVDDHEASRTLVADALSGHPMLTVATVATPKEGLAQATAFEPDLVILDIHLPGMSGYQLMEKLRAEAGCADTPIIALTADAMPDQVSRGQASGFLHYLTKPIDIARLQDIVARVLETEQRRKAASERSEDQTWRSTEA